MISLSFTFQRIILEIEWCSSSVKSAKYFLSGAMILDMEKRWSARSSVQTYTPSIFQKLINFRLHSLLEHYWKKNTWWLCKPSLQMVFMKLSSLYMFWLYKFLKITKNISIIDRSLIFPCVWMVIEIPWGKGNFSYQHLNVETWR